MPKNIPDLNGLVCTQHASKQIPAQAVGCFKLVAGRAISLLPQAPGELRIAHGRVWVTLGSAEDGVTVRAGDYFLSAGDLLQLKPGQQVVMEVYSNSAAEDVYFSWEPDAAACRALLSRRTQHAEVRQSLLDLEQALHQAAWALSRLAQGVAGHVACTLMRRRVAGR